MAQLAAQSFSLSVSLSLGCPGQPSRHHSNFRLLQLFAHTKKRRVESRPCRVASHRIATFGCMYAIIQTNILFCLPRSGLVWVGPLLPSPFPFRLCSSLQPIAAPVARSEPLCLSLSEPKTL